MKKNIGIFPKLDMQLFALQRGCESVALQVVSELDAHKHETTALREYANVFFHRSARAEGGFNELITM